MALEVLGTSCFAFDIASFWIIECTALAIVFSICKWVEGRMFLNDIWNGKNKVKARLTLLGFLCTLWLNSNTSQKGRNKITQKRRGTFCMPTDLRFLKHFPILLYEFFIKIIYIHLSGYPNWHVIPISQTNFHYTKVRETCTIVKQIKKDYLAKTLFSNGISF